MGWVTLTLRKASLKEAIHEHELRDMQLSREVRSIQRNEAYQRSIFENDKTEALNEAKKTYMTLRDQKKKTTDKGYEDWINEVNNAREDWEAKKLTISNYYDDVFNDLEEEATDEETRIQEEQTTLEAQLESMRSELESVNEQIKSDIDSSKINLS